MDGASKAYLELADGTIFEGEPLGACTAAAGEVVFNTGMVGYPEAITDPSYEGQILVFTYPLLGNYGIPASSPHNGIEAAFESGRPHTAGVVVSEASEHPSHRESTGSLDTWLRARGVPGLQGVDTRAVTRRLRERGSLPGRIVHPGVDPPPFVDPNEENLVARVGIPEPLEYPGGGKRVVLVDCGCKHAILRCLLAREVTVLRVPWDHPFSREPCQGVLLSNGPGDPVRVEGVVEELKRVMDRNTPVFGVCLGNQLLGLAAGARTYKLKYGHRSQNQPCLEMGTNRCFITSQNHGYAVDTRTLPAGWEPWFINANDRTNEGIRHRSRPFMSVQFHPEARPGPVDTEFLFDRFLESLE